MDVGVRANHKQSIAESLLQKIQEGDVIPWRMTMDGCFVRAALAYDIAKKDLDSKLLSRLSFRVITASNLRLPNPWSQEGESFPCDYHIALALEGLNGAPTLILDPSMSSKALTLKDWANALSASVKESNTELEGRVREMPEGELELVNGFRLPEDEGGGLRIVPHQVHVYSLDSKYVAIAKRADAFVQDPKGGIPEDFIGHKFMIELQKFPINESILPEFYQCAALYSSFYDGMKKKYEEREITATMAAKAWLETVKEARKAEV
ncbi:hypothetical protein SCG7109_AO_00100 [Chlamydiales bacterium SCGC AG-110-M15]|nr:hypothetical protein SCG7109_AO_00100 [Chlamydiales bacterium SCGC AG-110-M15]